MLNVLSLVKNFCYIDYYVTSDPAYRARVFKSPSSGVFQEVMQQNVQNHLD